MSKTARKIIIFFSVILFAVLLSSALPLIGSGKAYAAENQSQPQVRDVEEIKIPLRDFEMTYNGQSWNIESMNYSLVKIEDGEGHELQEARDAGDYTIYVTPAEGRVWEDGTKDEKTCSLTINKATLTWQYGTRLLEDNSLELQYQPVNSDVIDRITAVGVSTYGVYVKNIHKDWDGLEAYEKIGDTLKSKTKVQDVGEYVFKLKDYVENNGVRTYLYKNYTNPEFALKITPIRINIGVFTNMRWEPNFGELNTGSVYEYSYKVGGVQKTVYLTQQLAQAPYSDWTDWTFKSEKESKRGILAYCEGVSREISLAHSNAGTSQYFEAEYDGVKKANESGEYQVVATVTPVDNYEIYYEPQIPNTLTTEVVPQSDGSYKVYKTWYVALYINEFLDISSKDGEHRKIEYSFPQSWTFGTLPEGGIDMPYLAHGDELNIDPDNQPQGYSLSAYKNGKWVMVTGSDTSDEWITGEDDVVTFTLKMGETIICENQSRTKFNYFVNSYMPAGKYAITFTAKNINYGTSGNHNDWWNGFKGESCGTVHLGTTCSYEFEVFAGALLFDDSELNFADKDNPAPFRVDAATVKGDFRNFFGVANSKVSLGEGMITKSVVEQSGTYWATVAAKYYGEAIELNYHLKSADDLVFYSATADIWKKLIKESDTYYVYYTVNLPNYKSVPAAEDLATEFAKQYFIIELRGDITSGVSIGMIFLYVFLTLIAIGAVVAVVILLVNKKRGDAAVAAADGGENVQLEIDGMEKALPVSEPVEQSEPQLTEHPNEVQQTIEEAFTQPVEEQPAQPVEEQIAEEQPAQPVEKEVEKPQSVVTVAIEEPVEEQPVQPVEEAKPAEEQPAQPVEEAKPVEEQPAQPAYADYIEHIMEDAQAEYEAEHKGEAKDGQSEAQQSEKPAEQQQKPAEEEVQYSQYGNQQPQFNQFVQPIYPQPQFNQFGQPIYPQPQFNQFGQPVYPQPQFNQFGQPIYPQPQFNQFGQPVYPQPQQPQQPAAEQPQPQKPQKPEEGNNGDNGEGKA